MINIADKSRKVLFFKNRYVTAITALLIIVIGIIVLLFCYSIYFDTIAQRLKYANVKDLNELLLKKPSIIKEFKGPENINDISIKGYMEPKRELKKGESLVVIYDGEASPLEVGQGIRIIGRGLWGRSGA